MISALTAPTPFLAEVARLLRTTADAQPFRASAGASTLPYRRRVSGMTVEFYLDAAAGDYVLAVAREGAAPDRAECERLRAALGGPLCFSRWQVPYTRGELIIQKVRWARCYADLAGAGRGYVRVEAECEQEVLNQKGD